jgi:hypothetical protein
VAKRWTCGQSRAVTPPEVPLWSVLRKRQSLGSGGIHGRARGDSVVPVEPAALI